MNILVDGLREGYWEGYHNNGNLRFKGNYLNDKLEGYWEGYHNNGNISYRGSYTKGK